jgi:hypothetical protein
MSKELKELFPQENVIALSSESVTVSEFRFGQLATAFEFVDKYREILYTSPNPGLDLLSSGKEVLDDVAVLVEFTTGKDRQWLDSLSGGDALDLIYKIIEVNFDFFIQRFQRNSLDLARKLNSLGETSQPNSLPTDTSGEISEPIPSSK